MPGRGVRAEVWTLAADAWCGMNRLRRSRNAGVTALLFIFCVMPMAMADAPGPDIVGVRKDRPWIPATTVLANLDGRAALQDDVALGFALDDAVPGEWVVVDLVLDSYAFRPNQQIWQGNSFELVEAQFGETGDVTLVLESETRTDSWTRGHVLHDGRLKTDSAFTIVAIGDELYMFLQWKTEDYSIRFQKPPFFVLRKL